MKKLSKRALNLFALTASFVVFMICALVSTFSKYVTTTNAPFEGSEYLDYTVNSVFVVKNQEELFAAINQGYGYLQMDKNIENPLIITEKAETLNSDLILDLNGIELQRNGYEPILNVKENVRLTIVDTSEEGTGALYNPVGSVFNITGGTLTIVDGAFESGPRYSEYYSYNAKVLNANNATTKRTTVENAAGSVVMHTKQADGKFTAGASTTAPIIKSYPQQTGEIVYKHGNLYFDEAVTKGNVTIKPDTYCYYRTSQDIALDMSDTSMADWYYTYYVKPDSFDYVGATSNDATHIKITIYGYEKTIQKAMGISNSKDYYAAIQMQSGVLDVKQGAFNSYFGVDTTACVNAQGGTIDVAKGSFSSRSPNATTYTQYGVNVKEDDALAFGEGYFNNYQWATQSYAVGGVTYYGNLAERGEGHCILNAGNANVNIKKGSFYSSNNNIVSMEDGKLDVGGGTFTKRLTNGLQTTDVAKMSAIYMKQGELGIANATCTVLGASTNGLYMLDGVLDVRDTDYDIEGNNTKGIQMLHGKLSVTGGTCQIKGDTTYGIHSTVSGAGNFQVVDTSFVLTDGNNQTGIYAENSQIVLTSSSNTSAVGAISIEGTDAKGIHVVGASSVVDSNAYTYGIVGDRGNGIHMEDGTLSVDNAQYSITGASGIGINMNNGILTVQSASYNLSGAQSIGIQMLSGKLNVADATCNISGNSVYGIYSTVAGEGNFIVEDTSFTLTDGTAQTGIYAANGKIQLTNTKGGTLGISVEGENSKGLHVEGGAVESAGYNYTMAGASSYGIYAKNGTIGVDGGDITLSGSQNCYGIYSDGGAIQMQGGNIGVTGNQSCYGVYGIAQSGEDLDIQLSGANVSVGYGYTDNKTGTVRASVGVFLATDDPTNKITLTDTNIECYEVGVLIDGGALDVKSTSSAVKKISTRKASSIIVLGGGITFDASCNYEITSYATRNNDTTNVFNITLPTIDSNVNRAYDNFDGIYVDGGDVTSNGNVVVRHTGLYNDISKWTYYDDITIKSFAVRVNSGKVSVAKANIENTIGGGVMCDGGDVTLGTAGCAKSDITINASGHSRDQSWSKVVDEASSEWTVHKTKKGGHAVEIKGGNLTVHHGTYTAAYGDGIKLFAGKYTKADENSGKKRTTVDINNGEFIGNMTGEGSEHISGPAACYGVKVFGSAVINIRDGVFNGLGGGACVGGVTDYQGNRNIDYSADYPADVFIYKGKFGSPTANDGFMIYEFVNIIFGAAPANAFGAEDSAGYRQEAIVINSKLAPFSVNWVTYNTDNNSPARKSAYVAVYYGTYTGDYHGWNKSGNASAIQIYNQNQGYTRRIVNTTTGNQPGSVNVHNNPTLLYYPDTRY